MGGHITSLIGLVRMLYRKVLHGLFLLQKCTSDLHASVTLIYQFHSLLIFYDGSKFNTEGLAKEAITIIRKSNDDIPKTNPRKGLLAT
jgi:hypothetical protein